MISRDQAKLVANTTLVPSRRDLDARQNKVVRTLHRRKSPIFPAMFAALTAILTFDYSGNLTTFVMVGTLIGRGIGKVLRGAIR